MTDLAHELVLAVHPTSNGFGWVLFEGPSAAVDWGIASAKAGRNEKLLRRLARLLKRHSPDTVVMEAFEPGAARRSQRVQDLCRDMHRLAEGQSIATSTYRRSVIQAAFAAQGARTRHEIAAVIRDHVGSFSHRMPRKRRIWENEDPRQSLFDAAAVALIHFRAMTGDL